MNLWWFALAAIVTGLLTLYIWHRLHWRYVGFGIVFEHLKDGRTLVASRLYKSPAGEAGVRIGARLVNYDGIDMRSTTAAECRERMKQAGPKRVGDIRQLSFEYTDEEGRVQQQTVTLRAYRNTESIPVWRSVYLPQDDPDAWMYHRGVMYCEKTHQFVLTASLSDEALDQILSR